MTKQSSSQATFASLDLIEPLNNAIADLGFSQPTPIQEELIPIALEGHDVIGQAQTGTGKTAAFALPVLNGVDESLRQPQALVLAPTRELAIQVHDSFKMFAKHMRGLKLITLYGGQAFRPQLNSLKDGVHVIIGTPGRVMDHIRRGSLVLDEIKFAVLDEADEMLRMGFIDDIDWTLSQLPPTRQTLLLSATMPPPIRKLAENYLQDPQQVKIKAETATASNVFQQYLSLNNREKLQALSTILEVEDIECAIIFARTRISTSEIAEHLQNLGFRAAALNGDIEQKQREQIIHKLKNSHINFVVATDVAARGIDIERVSHVINYDMPFDVESYIHRIGRTGRAGKSGTSISFVTGKENRFLTQIERHTNQSVKQFTFPTGEELSEKRQLSFIKKLSETLEDLTEEDVEFYNELFAHESLKGHPRSHIASALAIMSNGGDKNALKVESPKITGTKRKSSGTGDTFRVFVGKMHNVNPKHIVGALCNEGGLSKHQIGNIQIGNESSIVELPSNLESSQLKRMGNIILMGQKLRLRREISEEEFEKPKRNRKFKGKKTRSKGRGGNSGKGGFSRDNSKAYRGKSSKGSGRSSGGNSRGKNRS